jgi:hypothetical protein
MNNCSICGEEEYFVTVDETFRRFETDNPFMCSLCTQKYISLPKDKQATFKLPLDQIKRKGKK